MKLWILIVALAVTGVELYLLAGLRATASWATPASAPSGGTNAGTSLAVEGIGPGSAHGGGASTSNGDETRHRLEAAFHADHAVAASHERARVLASGVRAVLPAGSTLRSVECRSALCRIETAHAS